METKVNSQEPVAPSVVAAVPNSPSVSPTTAPPSAPPVMPTTWLSTAKDMVGIIQNLFAIAAIIAGAIWFYEQDLQKPVIKTTIATNVIPLKDHYHVEVAATFENVGHVPYSFSCVGLIINRSNEQNSPPPTDCPKRSINPSEIWPMGITVEIPYTEADEVNYVVGRIGDVDEEKKMWREDAPGGVKEFFLPPQQSMPTK